MLRGEISYAMNIEWHDFYKKGSGNNYCVLKAQEEKDDHDDYSELIELYSLIHYITDSRVQLFVVYIVL